jgi:hypothetical protein
MSKGSLAVVLERIRQTFVTQVLGVVRDREAVMASREMAAEIEKPEESPIEQIRTEFERLRVGLAQEMAKPARVEKSHLPKSENAEREFRVHSESLYRAALRSAHAHSRVRRVDLHHCYVVETPTESAIELFAAALKSLGEK